MFCYGGYFNNPFMMNNNYFMPNYSFNFAMPKMQLFHQSLSELSDLYSSDYKEYSYLKNFSEDFFGFLNKKSTVPEVTVRPVNEELAERVYSDSPTNTLGAEFLAKVKDISNRLNCDYRDLLAVMNSESCLNSQAVNSKSGATGLIQFMPKTARRLGTTTDALKSMKPVEQLVYVEKYLAKMKKSAGFDKSDRLSGGDLYSLVFLPGRAKRDVLTTSNEKYYTWNTGLDANKDGEITKTELDQRVARKYVNESIFA